MHQDAASRIPQGSRTKRADHGVTVLPESSNGHGVLLAAAIQDFLDEKRVQRKPKTYA